MVWGCMSAQGVGALHIVEGNMNAEKYRNVMKDHLLPTIPALSTEYGEFIFQQDGATCHTARSTMAWFVENNVPVLSWPSGSPDLSPIETLWGKMKRFLKKNPRSTKAELIVALKEIWALITAEFCKKLVQTMPQRIDAVIKQKGNVTNW